MLLTIKCPALYGCTTTATSPYDWIMEVLPISISVVLPLVLYFLGFQQWKKQKKLELRITAWEQNKEKNLAVVRNLFSLCKFLSDKENGSNIIRRIKRQDQAAWYFDTTRFHAFNTAFADVFYTKGYGLYTHKEVKEIQNALFKARGVLYAFYDAYANADHTPTDSLIKIEDETRLKTYNKIREETILPKIKAQYQEVVLEKFDVKKPANNTLE